MIEFRLVGDVAQIFIANPPTNLVSARVRPSLFDALDQAEANSSVRAVVIAGAGGVFALGTDMTELRDPKAVQDAYLLCDRIEQFSKPVCAAIEGAAFGRGLALALACHYRVAHSGAFIGDPDIAQGVLPAAGITQRMPRLIGGGATLEALFSTTPLRVTDHRFTNLFSQIVDKDVLGAATDFVRMQSDCPKSCDAIDGFADPAKYHSSMEFWRSNTASNKNPALGATMGCVEAAHLLPFEAGIDFEQSSAEDVANDPVVAALQHMQIAENKISVFPETADAAKAPTIQSIALMGSGNSTSSLALVLLRSGKTVVIHSDGEATEARIRKELNALLEFEVKNKSMSADRMQQLSASVRYTLVQDEILMADLIVESSGDPIQIARNLGAVVDRVSSNTSFAILGDCAALDSLAEATGCGERLIGWRMAHPAHVQRLAELVVGEQTSATTVARLVGLVRQLRFIPMRAAPNQQTLQRHIQLGLLQITVELLDHGVAPEAIDAACRDNDMSQPPALVIDGIGIDRVAPIIERRLGTSSPVLQAMIGAGRTGRSAGRGLFKYAGGSAPSVDPVATALLQSTRPNLVLKPSQIWQVISAAMANEAARLIADGRVQRASDIDVVAVNACGFGRHMGGITHAADVMSLPTIQRVLRTMSEELTTDWTPDPLFAELIRHGKKFSSLN